MAQSGTGLISVFAVLVTAAAALRGEAAAAGGRVTDKTGYSLVTPVPAESLREMTTDRPDTTESPFTIDPGHVQLEMDIFAYGRDRTQGTRTTDWTVAAMNVRLGIGPDFEAGIFLVPYLHRVETDADAHRVVRSGAGDVTLRGKFNFWGNDQGETAFGLIADLTLPTAARGLGGQHVEAALALPMAIGLPAGWSIGAMTVLEYHERGMEAGHRAVWINTATIGHDLARNVGGYLEVTSAAGEGAHAATINLGLTWTLDANTQLDCGANVGLSRAADDLQLFAGLSRRY